MLTDREREFRLRPRKPPSAKGRNESQVWALLYKRVMRHARMTRKILSRGVKSRASTKSSRRFSQRCAVRVPYSRNAVRGQWAAHGRYLSRDSAGTPSCAAMNGDAETNKISASL